MFWKASKQYRELQRKRSGRVYRGQERHQVVVMWVFFLLNLSYSYDIYLYSYWIWVIRMIFIFVLIEFELFVYLSLFLLNLSYSYDIYLCFYWIWVICMIFIFVYLANILKRKMNFCCKDVPLIHSGLIRALFWMPRLIWVFARHTGHFVGLVMRFLMCLFAQWRNEAVIEIQKLLCCSHFVFDLLHIDGVSRVHKYTLGLNDCIIHFIY